MLRFLVVLFLISNFVVAQNQLVGYVVDNNQKPIIGALVKFEYAQSAFYSDYRGYFELNRDTFSILKVSALGYQTQLFHCCFLQPNRYRAHSRNRWFANMIHVQTNGLQFG